MKFQKALLTEPYDSAIALRYVETKTFSDELKYRILETHFKPDEDFTFSKTYLRRCNRLFNIIYLNNLFVYSRLSDSVFWIHCAQRKRKNLNESVNFAVTTGIILLKGNQSV